VAYYADRVKDTTTTTGTGSFTLAGSAPTGYQTFASGLGAATVVGVPYCCELNAEWEVGIGTFNGTTGLTRDVVLGSSNAGALVNFSAGTKNIFNTAPAALVEGADVTRAMFLTNYGV